MDGNLQSWARLAGRQDAWSDKRDEAGFSYPSSNPGT
jgi:hypothetical protein